MKLRRGGVGLVTFAALILSLAGVASADIVLPANTEVKVVLEKEASSKSAEVGDLVPIRLFTPIDFGGIIVVREGAKGSARVTEVEKAGMFGKPGSIAVELVELDSQGFYEAADGKKIKLQATEGALKAKGKSKKTLSFILGFGLIIKGSAGVIEAEKPIAAKIAEDIIILME